MTIFGLAETTALSQFDMITIGGMASVAIGTLGFFLKRNVESTDRLQKTVEALTLVMHQFKHEIEMDLVQNYVTKAKHEDDLEKLENRLKTTPPPPPGPSSGNVVGWPPSPWSQTSHPPVEPYYVRKGE